MGRGSPVRNATCAYCLSVTGYTAAAHLLRHSRLRVELADYEREDGTVAWERMTDERGYSRSERTLIRLAASVYDGALGDTSCLDDENYGALLGALDVLAYGERGGDPQRAGRRGA